ncbi:MAG: UDP-N-acetylmuramoyl-L-alanyl-D-glutamate--2,6-diaminopimelate ligase [Lachnospiraceae bacterium]|nr:UDP-N-acetylmuramoyl-L-alanyl-D-glutamate--2,6-diaminopimelate ligase [Lachnospiraceae bacterium]
MLLKNLIEKMDYTLVKGDENVEIKTLVYDSRKAEEGSVFVALKGAVSDGHKYLLDVIEKGASAVIVEDVTDELKEKDVTIIQVKDTREALALSSAAYFGYPAKELSTIGITGTKGKTTTTYMVKQILENAGIKTGLIGTIEIINGKENIPAVNTTPESYLVQKYFRDMVDNGLKCVVMEVSSQALKYKRVFGIEFDYGIFTNLSPDHIGPNEHDDFEDYLYSKSLLFKHCKQGIFNIDDENYERMVKEADCKVETFGFSENASLRANDARLINENGVLGVAYKLTGLLEMDVMIDIPGSFSVYNSLTAISICRHFGVSKEDILKALKTVKVKGRVETIKISDKFSLMIDYAHNAMSLESLLTTLKEYKPKRLVCLFGCGGNRSRDRRFEMGEISSKYADLSIVTSDNPRKEEPEAIIEDILVGVKKADGKYITIIDRKEAIRYAIENAEEGDVIVLAGKGHEDYQEINGKKYHMDERELVADVVKDGNFIK